MKNYRIVRIAGLHYDTPMVALYRGNPDLQSQSYAVQQSSLFRMRYVYSDSFSRSMRSLGHEAYEIVYDLEPLQKTWAKENGIKYDPRNWQHDILLGQIEALKPEVVYFQDIHSLPYSLRKSLKNRFPFIKLVVIYKGFPGAFNELADADVLFAGTPMIVEQFRNAGLKPYLLYHAFDTALLAKINEDCAVSAVHPCYDFTFIGSSGFGLGISHQSRYWALFELLERTGLEVWVNDCWNTRSFKTYLKSRIRKVIQGLLNYGEVETLHKLSSVNLSSWMRRIILEMKEQKEIESNTGSAYNRFRYPEKPLHKLFSGRCHTPVFGLEMYRVLQGSKVTFNKHTDAARGAVGNMRLFEATGVGTCLLTDRGHNLSELFEPDREVVTYSSTDECIEKLNYLLSHEDAWQRVAAAGQARTLSSHTVQQRCEKIDDLIQKFL